MIPNITRGGRIAGFMAYLIGPGRHDEHINQRIITGDDTITAMVEPGKLLSRDDALDISNVLDRPRKMHGVEVTSPVKEWDEEAGQQVVVGRRDTHMWQCSLSNGPEDEPLSDEAWARITEEFMTRMGFVDEDRAKTSRWVAIHHGPNVNGNDHVHIVAQMVTEDGSKAVTHNDYSRAQEVCGQLEREFGLAITEGRAHGQTVAQTKRGERERATRERQPWVEKNELTRRLRAALAASSTEAEFVSNVYAAGVIIEPRFAKGTTQKVAGYKVALPAPEGTKRDAFRYSPSRLDKNLSLPAVRRALGAPAGGDPAALGIWQEHHIGTVPRTGGPVTLTPTEALCERVGSGNASTADLANLYAAASLELERFSPDKLNDASQHLAQVASNPPPAGYMARQLHRATSHDAMIGWTAVLRQAGRLSMLMAQDNFDQHLPKLAEEHRGIIRTVIDAPNAPAPTPRKEPARAATTARPTQAAATSEGRRIPAEELARIREHMGTFDPHASPTSRSVSRPRTDPSTTREAEKNREQ
ncbi:relaxase/mobilization nuclease domain-containing protein [Brevibacterium sp. 5221]|uniref:Relaxase/mobilization nuclease domain-containing protein n=1 Tax=Brevibacterium rongguiense TaxID=2695267 RepID=A0A6N9HAC6_9MICO|nr:relaxase/mobilization nuclease domain-containing protein [Brevibacterium rongguiense]MYM20474.1 relaxase/mobilization nuclease domain-containing protein [Brevibacterium rongguiense]